jgi:hypothetical protein
MTPVYEGPMDPWTASVDWVHGLVDLFHGVFFRKIILYIWKIAGSLVFFIKTPLIFSKIMF